MCRCVLLPESGNHQQKLRFINASAYNSRLQVIEFPMAQSQRKWTMIEKQKTVMGKTKSAIAETEQETDLDQQPNQPHETAVFDIKRAQKVARPASSTSRNDARQSSRSKQPGDARQLDSRYTLIRQIGQGGLGDVWLGRDENLKRNVAIKEMNRSAIGSEKAWQRFHREAEITGHLEHPNVVSLYQSGTDPQTGEPFYVMRFVGKRSLADAIAEYHERCEMGKCDPLILHRLLSAFLDVCQAIAYAHSRGVIHRDLKPENVALDNYGQVIVLDWGLAKLAEDGELGVQLSGETQIPDSVLAKTMVGEAIGTPLYMAPEQASGDLDAIDHKTDIFGLGAILFAILTGSAPHAKSSMGEEGMLPIEEILEVIAKNETPSPRDFVKSVPAELEAICMKAMSKKKYARHESASELATEVERWMIDQGRRQAEYENMRMEGRELRANVQSEVRDLEANARFMSSLPPIQSLIRTDAENNHDLCQKLITIFMGLLRAKPNFCSIIYCRIDDDQFTEIARVERNSKEHASIGSIPRSRLRSEAVSQYMKNVINQNPEEVFTSLVCNPMSDACVIQSGITRLVAGVPVFDQQSEQLFGVVLVECDLDRVIKHQMNRRMTAADIVVSCDTYHVMMHNNTSGGWLEDSVGRRVDEILPKFNDAVESLSHKTEYIDEMDREIYGARLWLVPKLHGLMFLLSQK
jgi:serine/threonine protein kinase